MWRSIFLHEFPDNGITNYQAVDGRPTPASFTLAPVQDASTGTTSVKIAPSRGFHYQLEAPLDQIIGVSCHVRVSYPISPSGSLFPVIALGNDIGLELWPQTNPLPSLHGTMANTLVRIGTGHVNFGQIELPAATFTDLRFDWHTSGQASFFVDGRLAGYKNGVKPGAAFNIDKVMFGMPGGTPAASPSYLISKVFVRALRRTDSLATFTRMLPEVQVEGFDDGRCRQRILSNMMALLDRLRAFMTSFHEATSQPWTETGGPPQGPFKPQSREAHQLALKAGLALAQMLAANDLSNPEPFLAPFTALLKILKAELPAQFAEMAEEIEKASGVPEECKAAIEKALDKNQDTLASLLNLLTTALERVHYIAGE